MVLELLPLDGAPPEVLAALRAVAAGTGAVAREAATAGVARAAVGATPRRVGAVAADAAGTPGAVAAAVAVAAAAGAAGAAKGSAEGPTAAGCRAELDAAPGGDVPMGAPSGVHSNGVAKRRRSGSPFEAPGGSSGCPASGRVQEGGTAGAGEAACTRPCSGLGVTELGEGPSHVAAVREAEPDVGGFMNLVQSIFGDEQCTAAAYGAKGDGEEQAQRNTATVQEDSGGGLPGVRSGGHGAVGGGGVARCGVVHGTAATGAAAVDVGEQALPGSCNWPATGAGDMGHAGRAGEEQQAQGQCVRPWARHHISTLAY